MLELNLVKSVDIYSDYNIVGIGNGFLTCNNYLLYIQSSKIEKIKFD